jgi:hypothetical protein
LSRPKFELDTKITPLTLLDILYSEDFRHGRNDRSVLALHALANCLNRLQYLLLISTVYLSPMLSTLPISSPSFTISPILSASVKISVRPITTSCTNPCKPKQ